MSYPAGVPNLLNVPAQIYQAVVQVRVLDDLLNGIFGEPGQPQWGLYLEDKLALGVDGFVDFSINNGSEIAGYKIEKGAFDSFNKVDSPYDINAVAIKTGTPVELDAFLSNLDVISNDIKLYNFATPEQTYNNCNLEAYAYRRSTETGNNILFVNLMLKQIMSVTRTATPKPTKEQQGQPVKKIGTVTGVKQ